MKNAVTLFLVLTVFISCKSDKKETTEVNSEETTVVVEPGKTLKQRDGLIAIHGNFLYVEKDNAAVFQTPTQMYGVIVDDKMKELNNQVEALKTEPFEMVPVTIRGRIIKNEGATDEWENKIEIKEILKVSKPDPKENDVIKLGSK